MTDEMAVARMSENFAGLGEALHHAGDALPTWRGHNEQSMAHAAIAYAKANNCKRLMAVTSSIGPGATNMVTAAALAHVNRLPVLFLPGDVFANRSEACDRLAAFAERHGIRLAYHHHMGTVVETADDIEAFMTHAGPNTWLLLDTGHAAFAGIDPAALAERHMDRAVHIHAKNVRPAILRRAPADGLSFLQAVRLGVFTVPGDDEGCVDFAAVLRAAARHGYSGWLIAEAEQDPAERDPFVYQTLALKTLRALARDVGLDKGGGE